MEGEEMLNGLLKYGGLISKSKAIGAKQLKQEDYEQLMQKTSLAEIVAFLRNSTHYDDIFKDVGDKDLHRGDIENPLKKYYVSILKKYNCFVTGEDKKIIKMIFLREEIEALKDIMRRIEGDKERFIAPVDEYIAAHFSIDIKKLSEAKSMNEFVEMLSGTEYEKVLRKLVNADVKRNMFTIEMALDSHFYKQLAKMIKETDKRNRNFMKAIYGSEIDLKNIIWIYRCAKYYNVSKEIVVAYHLPYRYDLSKANFDEMLSADNLASLFKIIEKTKYKKLVEGLTEEGSGKNIEANYNRYFSNRIKELARKNKYSPVAMIEQLYSAECEIKKIINIVECIRYKLSVSEIKDLVG